MLRAFIAIKLSDDLKCHIEHVQADLKRQVGKLGAPGGIGWVKQAGIHLTLKFLGDIAEAQIEPLGTMLREAAAKVAPFSLDVRGVGGFPNSHSPRVIWLGVYGEDTEMDSLKRLQADIEEGAAALGFFKESRGFTPHLTLARVRDRRPARALEALLPEHRDRAVGAWTAGSVALIQSELHRDGARYTTLVEVPFGAGV
jgi:2'-5' RNA ligase